MKNLAISAAELVDIARQRIEEVETDEALALLRTPSVVFVDLRDVRERERSGYIPGSFHCPRGMAEFWVDPKSPYFKEIFGEEKRFIFHCASGWRSALTVDALTRMGFPAAHLKHGFTDWVEKGGPIEFPKSSYRDHGRDISGDRQQAAVRGSPSLASPSRPRESEPHRFPHPGLRGD